MKQIIFLSLLVASCQICAMAPEIKTIWKADEPPQKRYNPFRDGYVGSSISRVRNYDEIYAEYARDIIIKIFGSEVFQFYCDNPEETESQVVRRYVEAIIVRLAVKRQRSRKIDIIRYSIPANLQEYNFIRAKNQSQLTQLAFNQHAKRAELENYFKNVLIPHASDTNKLNAIKARLGLKVCPSTQAMDH